MKTINFDYIVVGAGATGCTLAARLSEVPTNRVLLLEAGGFNDFRFQVPGFAFAVSTNEENNWGFTTEPNPELNDRRLKVHYGKVLGGSSSINGMQWARGHSGEYDAWARMGCEGWGWNDVLPFFRKAEGDVRGASHWHGGAGPLKVRPANPNLPICDAFLEAAADAGFGVFDDMNRDVVDGFGMSDVNIYRGRRMSSAVAYLRPAMRRKNLVVVTRTQVRRVVIENGKTKGVEIANGGRTRTIPCNREVIVCGGGIKSPHVLMLSGIGPADHLREFGIPVKVDSPNVGGNFQNHVCYRLQYACSAPVTAYQHLRPRNLAKSLVDYALFRKGPLSESFVAAGGLFRSDPSFTVPDMQATFIVALSNVPSSANPKPWELLPKQDGFSITVHGTPFSRGEIRLGSADPFAHPKIFSNYLSDRRDVDSLRRAIEIMRGITGRPAMRRYIRAELLPGDALQTREELETEMRRTAANSYHPVGACAMGGDPSSVVDPQLRVRGVEGLRVADNSVLPTIPNAGLHAPAIMIGEKAAAMILA